MCLTYTVLEMAKRKWVGGACGVDVELYVKMNLCEVEDLAHILPTSCSHILLSHLAHSGSSTHTRYKGLHRVYVVDSARRPASIITLTDVLRTIIKFDGETCQRGSCNGRGGSAWELVRFEEADEDENGVMRAFDLEV